jgi:hypothetical protein
VPIDKSEGSVKGIVSPGRRVSAAWFAREVEDQSSGNLTLNHFSVELVPPTIDSAETSTMILLCEHPASCGMRERPIKVSV